MRCLDAEASARMREAIKAAGQNHDTLGGVFEVWAFDVLPGLGSHVSGDARLDGRLGQAIMGIQAIKGVEIGAGFELGRIPGSQAHDEIFHDAESGYFRRTNRSGGIEGGMTHGAPVVVRAVMKPISTLSRPLASVDVATKEPRKAFKERADICAVPAAAVVAEAEVAFVLARALLEKFGGDSIDAPRRGRRALPGRDRAVTWARWLVLSGFMGAGKTSVGRRVASRLGCAFVDADREIEARAGMPIPEIFSRRGELWFRRTEETVIRELLAGAAGRARPRRAARSRAPRTRALLTRVADVVWLRASVDVAWARVKDSDRPLATDRGRFERRAAAREATYREAAAPGGGRGRPGRRGGRPGGRVGAARPRPSAARDRAHHRADAGGPRSAPPATRSTSGPASWTDRRAVGRARPAGRPPCS